MHKASDMKQLQMTPELSALIKKAVGEDVDTTNLAVFETIALNTRPLPGKKGSLFEQAIVEPVTLLQMVDSINAGNHLPLIADHELFGAPKGRVFHAGIHYGEEGMEMRALFYLDQTEAQTIAKLNAGSLDEVSVAFLSSQFLCSECGWDYMEHGKQKHIAERTCENGHEIGEDGVHGRMIGLNQFIELSVVARGAADKPKIVGKSESKLAPESAMRLAAHGFQPDAWVCRASAGTDIMSDNTQIIAQLTEATGKVAVLEHEKGQLTTQLAAVTGERDTARSELDTANATIASLTAERDEALTRPDATVQTERDEAVTILQEQVNALRVALGEDKLEGDALPSTVAELKAKITELNGNLTAAIPTGGLSQRAGGEGDGKTEAAFVPAAFALRK